jgi:hypothetical protein
VLAPGLELLVSDTLYTQSRREIQTLISHARQLFTKSGSA